jgi:hypothetical protein
MNRSTNGAVSQSIPSLTDGISLVDLDGGPVPIWAKDAPVVPPFDPDEESDPADWPSWTDNWRWVPTADDIDDADCSIPVDAILVPPELLELAAIAGGAPEFVPSASDWADYHAWCDEVDRREELRAAEQNRNPEFGYE